MCEQWQIDSCLEMTFKTLQILDFYLSLSNRRLQFIIKLEVKTSKNKKEKFLFDWQRPCKKKVFVLFPGYKNK